MEIKLASQVLHLRGFFQFMNWFKVAFHIKEKSIWDKRCPIKSSSFSSREEQAFSECYLFCFSNNIKTNLPPSVAGKRYISLLPQWSYSVLPLFDEKSVNCRPEAKTQLGLNLLRRSILIFIFMHFHEIFRCKQITVSNTYGWVIC